MVARVEAEREAARAVGPARAVEMVVVATVEVATAVEEAAAAAMAVAATAAVGTAWEAAAERTAEAVAMVHHILLGQRIVQRCG